MIKFLVLLFPIFLYAEDLITEFNVQKNPGSGNLVFTQGGNPKNLELGAQTGYYGMGMVLKGSLLKSDYQKELKNKIILQLNFGNFNAKSLKESPQFSTLTLVDETVPKKEVTYQLKTSKPENINKIGLMLFQSPFTPEIPGPEQRLQNSYFAKLGTVKVSPTGKIERVPIVFQNKNYELSLQRYKVSIDGLLTTPFDASQNPALRANVEIPVYYANSPDEEKLIFNLAQNSQLSGTQLIGEKPKK
jgi:hypothetical protein